ncbi:MAG: hypothetical protein AAFR19_05225 [Pseudomonadota bacterium]
MANKRPKPKETVSKSRQVEVLMGHGMPRPEQPPAEFSTIHPICT